MRQTSYEVKPGRSGLVLGWVTNFKPYFFFIFCAEMHRTQYRCLRRLESWPVFLHKSCPLTIQTVFQGKTLHRYTPSQDCVGVTNIILSRDASDTRFVAHSSFSSFPHIFVHVRHCPQRNWPPLAARKLSHILGQTPATLVPVFRWLASISQPLFV